MGIKLQVTVDEYECDGCGGLQYGQLGEPVEGIIGSFSVHNSAGGASYDYFACGPKCHTKALKNAIDPWGNKHV